MPLAKPAAGLQTQWQRGPMAVAPPINNEPGIASQFGQKVAGGIANKTLAAPLAAADPTGGIVSGAAMDVLPGAIGAFFNDGGRVLREGYKKMTSDLPDVGSRINQGGASMPTGYSSKRVQDALAHSVWKGGDANRPTFETAVNAEVTPDGTRILGGSEGPDADTFLGVNLKDRAKVNEFLSGFSRDQKNAAGIQNVKDGLPNTPENIAMQLQKLQGGAAYKNFGGPIGGGMKQSELMEARQLGALSQAEFLKAMEHGGYLKNKGPLAGVKYKQTGGKVTHEAEMKYHNPLAGGSSDK